MHGRTGVEGTRAHDRLVGTRSARRLCVVAVVATTIGGLLVSGCASTRRPTDADRHPTHAWVQRFTRAVALGEVGPDGTFPGYSSSALFAYQDDIESTNGGVYRPSVVNAVRANTLIWSIPGGGVGSSVTIGPSAIGGEWSIRMRTDLVSGMRIASMLWPDNNVWPGTNGSGGEIDFPEEELTGRHPYAAVVGDAGTQRGGVQLFNPETRVRTPRAWTSWHTYTIQVTPGKRIRMFQDGVRVASVTDNVPRTKVRQQIQVESIAGLKGGRGLVEVSAAAYSPVLDDSSARAVAP